MQAARDRPGGRILSPREAGYLWLPDLPGGHQRLGRPEAAAVHRPRHRYPARKSIFSTTAFPPWTSRPTRPCARALRDQTAEQHGPASWPSASAPSCTRTRFIVLDEGKIVGRGTHKELMESCEEYRQIAESQLVKGGIGTMSDAKTSPRPCRAAWATAPAGFGGGKGQGLPAAP